jgi:hypothetical protein
MKKLLPVLIGVIVIAAAVTAFLVLKKDNKDASSGNKPSIVQPVADTAYTGDKRACDVITLDDAMKVLGASAKAGSTNSDAPTEGPDVVVSTCTYSNDSAAPGQSKTASVLVRSAKSTDGAESNMAQFSDQKPAGTQDVAGYGEAAFWNATFGQLNVLKNGNWYIISNGPIKTTDRTVDQAKQLADVINAKF